MGTLSDALARPKRPAAVPSATVLGGRVIWIYGEPKIGKTTLASQFPGVIFLATEPGQDFVDCYPPIRITTWTAFELTVDSLIKELSDLKLGSGETAEPIQYVAIDTVDELHRMANDHVCNSFSIDDPGEMGHGKAWARLRSVVFKTMGKLRSTGLGIIAISHASSREFKSGSIMAQRTEPATGAAMKAWLWSASDLCCYAHSASTETGSRRALGCTPKPAYLAGGRMTHLVPALIPMSYASIISAITSPRNTGGQTPPNGAKKEQS